MRTRLRGSTFPLLGIVPLLGLGVSTPASAEAPGTTLVPTGATWSYLDDGTDQGTAWREPGFVESWDAGPAQLGYGDGDEATVVSFGPDSSNKYITTYFRQTFPVSDPSSIIGLTLSLLRDDGAIVYLNGVEVVRSNMPAGAVNYLTLSASTVEGSEEDAFFDFCVAPSLLVQGDNLLAVEIHQRGPTSSDISLDLSLSVSATFPSLVRPPYLQNGTPGSVVVRWRTDACSETRVSWGDAPGNLTNALTDPAVTSEHELEISGLAPATKYFYSVGTTAETLAGDDPDHFFVTLPVAGTRTPIRIWAIGDSGQCAQTQQGCDDAGAVRDAYLAFAGSEIADAWLMLGDNAYNSGTDQQYTDAVFNLYPTMLRNTILWPAPGNHEFGASDSPSQTGPYYDSFTMPTQAEAGGMASGTEAYYSFDYGNVHFVALDSHDTSRAAPSNPETNVCPGGQGGAMYQWLCDDLAATNQDFIIVYWHHPPYTKGSHNSDGCSDSGGRMCEMRERFLPVLESFGADLQLTGHSHAYERSVLIDGHYGFSGECSNGECFVDGGDGDPAGDGAYIKDGGIGPVPHEGAVYSVVGSSSKTSGGALNHPVMSLSLNALGSMVIDVVGRQLDGYFIDDGGSVRDHFRILKGPVLPVCNDGLDNDGDGLIDFPDDLVCVSPTYFRENSQCQDGLDNDTDGFIDFDGGVSAGLPLAQVTDPDPQCLGLPWKNREAIVTVTRRCGLGFELALLVPALIWLHGRRRRGEA